MSDDNVTPLPQHLDLDLDTFERKPEDVIAPFTVKLGGRVVTMSNPDEIAWQDLVDIRDPVQFLRYSCSRDDFTFLLGLDLPAFKMARLMEAYQTHFKIDERVDNVVRAERLRGR